LRFVAAVFMNGKLLKDDKKPPVMHLVIKHRWET